MDCLSLWLFVCLSVCLCVDCLLQFVSLSLLLPPANANANAKTNANTNIILNCLIDLKLLTIFCTHSNATLIARRPAQVALVLSYLEIFCQRIIHIILDFIVYLLKVLMLNLPKNVSSQVL